MTVVLSQIIRRLAVGNPGLPDLMKVSEQPSAR